MSTVRSQRKLSAVNNGVATLAEAGYRSTVRLLMTPEMRLAGSANARGVAAATVQAGPSADDHLYQFRTGTLATGGDGNIYSTPNLCPPYDGATPCTGSCGAGQVCLWNDQSNPASRYCGTPFLECAARSSAFQGAFNKIDLGGTVFLTVNDQATAGIGGSLSYQVDLAAINVRSNEILEEYRRMTLALYQTQHDSGKTFVIDNWETDNVLYGEGGPGVYIEQRFVYPRTCSGQDPSVPASSCDTDGVCNPQTKVGCADSPNNWSCEANKCIYAHNRSTGASPPLQARLAALRRWFELRRDGIAQGRRDAAVQQLSNVNVVDGIEINNTRFIDYGIYSVLNDIVGPVSPTYVSYSAWGSAAAAGTLDEDIVFIEDRLSHVSPGPSITGVRPYFALGELGIAESNPLGPASQWRLIETAKAAYRARVLRPGTPSLGSPPTILRLAYLTSSWTWKHDWDDALLNRYWAAPAAPPDYGLVEPLLEITGHPYGSYSDERLFGANGDEKPQSVALRNSIIAYAATGILPPQSIMIYNIADFGLDSSTGQHRFSFSGAFPLPPSGSHYTVTATCNGGSAIPGGHTYVASSHDEQSGSFLVGIPNPGTGCISHAVNGAYCTFSVNLGAGLVSPDFGPRHICPGSTASSYGLRIGQDWAGRCNGGC